MLCKGVTVDVDGVTGLDQLYEEVGPRLWRSILAFTGGRRDLDVDVVAEAFLRTLESGNNVRHRWAYQHWTAFRLAAQELARGLGHLVYSGARRSGRSRAQRVVRRASFAIAERAGRRVPALPSRLPIGKIADILGSSAGAVRVDLFRGRRKFEALLGGMKRRVTGVTNSQSSTGPSWIATRSAGGWTRGHGSPI